MSLSESDIIHITNYFETHSIYFPDNKDKYRCDDNIMTFFSEIHLYKCYIVLQVNEGVECFDPENLLNDVPIKGSDEVAISKIFPDGIHSFSDCELDTEIEVFEIIKIVNIHEYKEFIDTLHESPYNSDDFDEFG